MTLDLHSAPRNWRTRVAMFCVGFAVSLGLACIASCGGGGVVGSGGTGVPYGVTQGTVNGFGSIIVDGVGYDERSARVVVEVGPGQDVLSDVKLGNRVSLVYQMAGVAQGVRVEPTLIGPVASVASANQFSMLGQDVRVNTSAATGPVTQFGGGYTQPGDVRAGDSVELHGVVVTHGPSYLIQATRIDKLAAGPAYLRVTGVLANLSAGAAPAFSLGALVVDAQAALLLPEGVALANGQTVTLLALPATLTAPIDGTPRLKAAQIRVAGVHDSGLDNYVSGSISQLDAQAGTFTLGSLAVRYAGASVTPVGTALANGQYVQVRGSVAADAVLVAVGVMVRDGRSEVEGELKGNIAGFVAGTASFNLRGVQVDARRATLTGCPNTGLANGLFVEVQGALSANGVVAATVHCEGEPAGAIVEREGVASSVDLLARRFTLTSEQGSVTPVTWSDSTYFGRVSPASLAGKKVHVEGSIVNGVMAATKVQVDD